MLCLLALTPKTVVLMVITPDSCDRQKKKRTKEQAVVLTDTARALREDSKGHAGPLHGFAVCNEKKPPSYNSLKNTTQPILQHLGLGLLQLWGFSREPTERLPAQPWAIIALSSLHPHVLPSSPI